MIYLFNTNIVPSASIVRVSEITVQRAKDLLDSKFDPISAIGHEATAKCMSTLLDVQVNRINAQPQAFDKAISLKLNGRLEEGKILSLKEMETTGFTLFLLEFYPSHYVIAPDAEYYSNSQYY